MFSSYIFFSVHGKLTHDLSITRATGRLFISAKTSILIIVAFFSPWFFQSRCPKLILLLNGTIFDSNNLVVFGFKGVHALAGQFEILPTWGNKCFYDPEDDCRTCRTLHTQTQEAEFVALSISKKLQHIRNRLQL